MEPTSFKPDFLTCTTKGNAIRNERLINSEIISEVESSEGFNSKLYLKMMGIVNKRVDLSFVRSNHQITG